MYIGCGPEVQTNELTYWLMNNAETSPDFKE